MKQNILALVGISGVGKSTLLRSLSGDVRFQHLQASALIREQRLIQDQAEVTTDSLRGVDIDENQRLLIAGFRRSVDRREQTVVLDGHTIVDAPGGLIEIDKSVFKELGISRFIFLADNPEHIARRREKDDTRRRPIRTVEELANQQEAALMVAFRMSLNLQVPLRILNITESAGVSKVLTEYMKEGASI